MEVDALIADEGIDEEADGVEGGADVDGLELVGLADEGEAGLGDVEDAAGFFGGGAGEGCDSGEMPSVVRMRCWRFWMASRGARISWLTVADMRDQSSSFWAARRLSASEGARTRCC